MQKVRADQALVSQQMGRPVWVSTYPSSRPKGSLGVTALLQSEVVCGSSVQASFRLFSLYFTHSNLTSRGLSFPARGL